MLRSMTGFGRGEHESVVVHVKSVNHRYKDITVKVVRKYNFLEEPIKNLIKTGFSRGKAEVGIDVETTGGGNDKIDLDLALAKQYYNNMRELQRKFDTTGDISLELLSCMPDVMQLKGEVENEEKIIEDALHATREALVNFNSMREDEGGKLAADILSKRENISEKLKSIRAKAPEVSQEYERRLTERIAELLEWGVARERIITETAIFADKIGIDEELVRLDSHLIQLGKILNSDDNVVGKKLDFLVQELNREANNIGAKAKDLEITNNVLDMKSEIEKIREQVQNIE